MNSARDRTVFPEPRPESSRMNDLLCHTLGKAPCSSQKRLSFMERAGDGPHEVQRAVQQSLLGLAEGRRRGLSIRPCRHARRG